MTPKEKAKDLYVKFSDYCSWNTFEQEQDFINNIKQCALIAVNEIIEVTAPYCDSYEPYYLELKAEMTQQYWQKVKQEIQNL